MVAVTLRFQTTVVSRFCQNRRKTPQKCRRKIPQIICSRGLCWLHGTSVLKRDSVHPRMSPVRSVFSRLFTRVSQPAGRPWLPRSRRLFRLFPTCNPPCVQVCPVFTCYAHGMAARPGSVSPQCSASGPATPTALLVGVDSSRDDPS